MYFRVFFLISFNLRSVPGTINLYFNNYIMKNYEELMSEYTDIEFKAHVELDDVLNKVTQEIWEIVEAKEAGDIQEMYSESWDALVNVASASYQLWVEPNLEKPNDSEVSSSKLLIDLSDWNSKIQWYRNRYSRQEETIESVTESTNTLISDILSFSNPNLGALEMLENSIDKFKSREWKYFENIDLKDYIRSVPDFPKEWIDFKDISPLLENRDAMKNMIFEMAEKCRWADIIAWLDARWFLFGEAIANLLDKPFVMIRKAGKLPWETIWIKYWLEYWSDEIELQNWAIEQWQKIALVDDLLATWWTMWAAAKLVEQAWWEIENIVFAISLDEQVLQDMSERQNLWKYTLDSILQYN